MTSLGLVPEIWLSGCRMYYCYCYCLIAGCTQNTSRRVWTASSFPVRSQDSKVLVGNLALPLRWKILEYYIFEKNYISFSSGKAGGRGGSIMRWTWGSSQWQLVSDERPLTARIISGSLTLTTNQQAPSSSPTTNCPNNNKSTSTLAYVHMVPRDTSRYFYMVPRDTSRYFMSWPSVCWLLDFSYHP